MQNELTFKEKLNKPVVKFGCIPSILLLIVLIIAAYTGNDKYIDFNGNTIDTKTIVNDFCTKNLDYLTKNYGDYIYSKSESGEMSYEWVLNKESRIRVMLFENEKNKREVARFFNFDFGAFFWETVGWDKNNFDYNGASYALSVSDLNGIKIAVLKEKINVLNVELTGEIDDFGKK